MKNPMWTIAAATLLTASLAAAQNDRRMPAGGHEMPMGNKMADNAKINETLLRQEEMVQQALVKKDWATFKKYVMNDAWSVDGSGYMTAADFLKALSDPSTKFSYESFKISDAKVINVDANTALVTYKLDSKGSFMGQMFPPTVYATTVWTNHGGMWMGVFHQETRVAAMPGK